MMIPPEAVQCVRDFFTDTIELGHNANFSELEYGKAKRNYDRISKELMKAELPNPSSFRYSKLSLDELKQLMSDILNKIFDNKYKEEIKYLSSLIVTEKNPNPFLATLAEKYHNGVLIPEQIYISDKMSSIEVVSTAHELIHAMLTKYIVNEYNKVLNNVHYQEFLSILIEYVVCYELSQLIKEDKLTEKHNIIRLYHNQEQIQETTTAQNLNLSLLPINDQEIMKLYVEYQLHNSYGYILSDIYSFHLLDVYKKDSKALVNIVSSIIDGKKCINDLISFYKLNLSRNDIIFKYINRIDETSVLKL